MNKLWAFGDSFTDFYTPPIESEIHWRHKYIEWKGYAPKVYIEFIAEKLNMDLVNKGIGGCDNLHIFEEFCKVCDKIAKDDIVVFGWTSPIRFRLATKNNKWGFFNPQKKNKTGFFAHMSLDKFELLSENTIKEVLLNRTSFLYSKEINNWIKLINLFLKDIRCVHWAWYKELESEIIFCPGPYKSIKDETNGQVDDAHWCEEGHREFSDLLLEKIFENKPISIKKLL